MNCGSDHGQNSVPPEHILRELEKMVPGYLRDFRKSLIETFDRNNIPFNQDVLTGYKLGLLSYHGVVGPKIVADSLKEIVLGKKMHTTSDAAMISGMLASADIFIQETSGKLLPEGKKLLGAGQLKLTDGTKTANIKKAAKAKKGKKK